MTRNLIVDEKIGCKVVTRDPPRPPRIETCPNCTRLPAVKPSAGEAPVRAQCECGVSGPWVYGGDGAHLRAVVGWNLALQKQPNPSLKLRWNDFAVGIVAGGLRKKWSKIKSASSPDRRASLIAAAIADNYFDGPLTATQPCENPQLAVMIEVGRLIPLLGFILSAANGQRQYDRSLQALTILHDSLSELASGGLPDLFQPLRSGRPPDDRALKYQKALAGRAYAALVKLGLRSTEAARRVAGVCASSMGNGAAVEGKQVKEWQKVKNACPIGWCHLCDPDGPGCGDLHFFEALTEVNEVLAWLEFQLCIWRPKPRISLRVRPNSLSQISTGYKKSGTEIFV